MEPAASVDDGSVDIIFLALPTFAEQFAALVSWTPKLKNGGVLVVYWALTTADVAAAVYIYAIALPLSWPRTSYLQSRREKLVIAYMLSKCYGHVLRSPKIAICFMIVRVSNGIYLLF